MKDGLFGIWDLIIFLILIATIFAIGFSSGYSRGYSDCMDDVGIKRFIEYNE